MYWCNKWWNIYCSWHRICWTENSWRCRSNTVQQQDSISWTNACKCRVWKTERKFHVHLVSAKWPSALLTVIKIQNTGLSLTSDWVVACSRPLSDCQFQLEYSIKSSLPWILQIHRVKIEISPKLSCQSEFVMLSILLHFRVARNYSLEHFQHSSDEGEWCHQLSPLGGSTSTFYYFF